MDANRGIAAQNHRPADHRRARNRRRPRPAAAPDPGAVAGKTRRQAGRCAGIPVPHHHRAGRHPRKQPVPPFRPHIAAARATAEYSLRQGTARAIARNLFRTVEIGSRGTGTRPDQRLHPAARGTDQPKFRPPFGKNRRAADRDATARPARTRFGRLRGSAGAHRRRRRR